MIEEIKEDNNCIVKAFENNPIAILHEDINNKKVYYFKASDIGKALNLTNIRASIQNYDEDEHVVKLAYDPRGCAQDTTFLTSQGVYRLLYNSKKEIAKKFRKWAGNILDDIIFNESVELKRQLQQNEEKLLEQKGKIEETNELLLEQEKKINLLENKPKTHGFLARRHGYVYMITDRSKPGHYKIGMSYNVDKRLRNLNTSSSEKSLSVYHEIKTYDCELLEKTIHSILQPFNICGRREWFFLSNKIEIQYTLHTIHKINNFLNNFNITSPEQFIDYITKETIEILPNTVTLNNVQAEVQEVQPKVQAELQEVQPKVQLDIQETNIFKLTGQQLTNKTGNYKGVSWSKEKQKWKAELKMAYKIAFLGYYDTELEGAKAYNNYALYMNNEMKTDYVLNDIEDYVTIAINIPKENEQIIFNMKSSKYIGVSYDSKRKYFVAGIKYKCKSYGLGHDINEIECSKLYNQQALFFNENYYTEYMLNEIPDYITIAKNIHQEIQDKVAEKKKCKYRGVSLGKNGKYRVVLVHNKKQIHIGIFENELDGAKAYNKRASELNSTTNSKYKLNEFT